MKANVKDSSNKILQVFDTHSWETRKNQTKNYNWGEIREKFRRSTQNFWQWVSETLVCPDAEAAVLEFRDSVVFPDLI